MLPADACTLALLHNAFMHGDCPRVSTLTLPTRLSNCNNAEGEKGSKTTIRKLPRVVVQLP